MEFGWRHAGWTRRVLAAARPRPGPLQGPAAAPGRAPWGVRAGARPGPGPLAGPRRERASCGGKGVLELASGAMSEPLNPSESAVRRALARAERGMTLDAVEAETLLHARGL